MTRDFYIYLLIRFHILVRGKTTKYIMDAIIILNDTYKCIYIDKYAH